MQEERYFDRNREPHRVQNLLLVEAMLGELQLVNAEFDTWYIEAPTAN